MKLARGFAMWFGLSGLLILLAPAMPDKPNNKVGQVTISVQNVNKDVVTFQTLLPAMFVGILHGQPKGRIQKCDVFIEQVAELKDGGKMNNIVLHCSDASIVITDVLFQN